MREINFLTRPDFTKTLESMDVNTYFDISVFDMARESARNLCSHANKRLNRFYRVVALDNTNYRVMRLS